MSSEKAGGLDTSLFYRGEQEIDGLSMTKWAVASGELPVSCVGFE